MILEPETYDIGRVKKFMRHLVLASKRISEKEQRRDQFARQVEKVKKLSLERAPKEKLNKEFEKLQGALKELVVANKQMIGAEQSNSEMLRKALEHLEGIGKSISSSENFSDFKQNLAEERLKEISGKIKTKFSEKDINLMEEGLEKMRAPDTSSEIDSIEKQLKLLELKHAQLKRSGKHDPQTIARVEAMIKTSKGRLKGLRA